MSTAGRARSATLSPEQWARAQALFLEIVELTPEVRAGRLQGLASQSSAVAIEVRRMVEAEMALELDELEPTPPERIGRYRILRKLGAGGMGIVYLAEAIAEDVTTQVALKVLPRGADALVDRFRAERRILATLEHPHIARFLDAGATEDGRPFLVMEYVDGVPIHDFARARGLGVDARLELVRQVCEAAHHAHQRLIVHRDIKPGNVLVDDRGQCKLLDFGIAKVLHARTQDALTSPTAPAGLTPAYASPEQIAGEEVTTATDVYALGAVLFEVLSDVRLADARAEAGLPRPSRAVHDAARRRRLRGDLDTIVLKAVQPEPADRYPTALSLLEDIERHRGHLPIRAAAPSPLYVVGRLVRRRPWSSASIIGLALATGALVVSLMSQAKTLERKNWEAEFTRVTLSEALSQLAHDVSPAVTSELEQVLDDQVPAVRSRLTDSPEAQGELLRHFGDLYRYMERTPKAIELYQSALTVQRRAFGLKHPGTAKTAMLLAAGHMFLGRFDRAEGVARMAADGFEASTGPGSVDFASALNLLCGLYATRRDYARSRPLCLRAYRIRLARLPSDHPSIAQSLYNLGAIDLREGRPEAALALLDRSLEARYRDPGATSPTVAEIEIARAMFEMGRREDGFARLEHALSRLQIEPKPIVHQLAFMTRARLNLVAGRPDAALSDLVEARKSRPDDGNYPWLRLEIAELSAVAWASVGAQARADEARDRAKAIAARLGMPLQWPAVSLAASPR